MRIIKNNLWLLLAGMSLFLFSCSKRSEKSITVFAASSMTDVVSEIAMMYQDQNGVKVNVNFASSGNLARQINSGAQADIFMSASSKWISYVIENGLADKEMSRRLMSNRLVLVAPLDSKITADQLFSEISIPEVLKGRFSIGDPAHVPVGAYAKEALVSSGLYDTLSNRLLLGQNTRATLMTVELGETELGIVYRTDALKSKKVKVIAQIPTELHQPILYEYLFCKNGKSNAVNFFDFLKSERAKNIYSKYGFIPIDDE